MLLARNSIQILPEKHDSSIAKGQTQEVDEDGEHGQEGEGKVIFSSIDEVREQRYR